MQRAQSAIVCIHRPNFSRRAVIEKIQSFFEISENQIQILNEAEVKRRLESLDRQENEAIANNRERDLYNIKKNMYIHNSLLRDHVFIFCNDEAYYFDLLSTNKPEFFNYDKIYYGSNNLNNKKGCASVVFIAVSIPLLISFFLL